MKKSILEKSIRKLISTFLLLYAYNSLVFPIGMVIPFNVVTLFLIYIFGIPVIFALAVIKICFFI